MNARDGHRVPGERLEPDSEHNDYSRRMCTAQHEGFGCTRKVDHPGQHEAAGITQIMEVWS